MKKSLALLLVLTLIISMFALVGCGSDDSTDGDALSVCVVVSSGFGDKSFNDSAKEGADRLADDYGVNVSYIQCNEENFDQQMRNAADNADVVVPVGWQFYNVSEVADEYPDVKFIWVDNEVENVEDHPNILCIKYAQNEGSFLAGYIAAKMSTSGVVGAVGGENSDVINDFIVGYKQGAKYADPDVDVVVNYANDYENPAKGKECAIALHDKGADVIFQIAGNTGNGVIEACAEQGIYAIGVDQDQKISLPNYDETIICSMKKEVGTSIYDAIANYASKETWEGGRIWTADIGTGYIGISYGDENSTQQVGEKLKAEVDELSAKIVDGDIQVDTTRS